MPRPSRRALATVLFLAAAGGLAAQTGPLGFNKLETKPPSDQAKLGQLREGKLKTTGPDLKANQKLFRDLATYHVRRLTDPALYVQEESGNLKVREVSGTADQVILDVSAQLLQPGPGSNYNEAQREYLVEFGAALNEAIRDVLKTPQPAPVRVNVGRLLELGAKSGAPAFAPTIHELLTNKFPLAGKVAKTPPDLFLYAIRAAGNLFRAYDPQWQFNSDPRTQFRHSFPLKDQIALAGDLLTLLEKGPGMAELAAVGDPDKPIIRPVRTDIPTPDAPSPADKKADKQATLDNAVLTPEQAAVDAYYRRAVAVAVTKIRPDLLAEPGQPPLRPGLALAQIAVSDSRINPPPTVPEVAEALIGLCYIQPGEQKLNIPQVLDCIAAAGRTVVQGYNNRKSDPEIGKTAQLVPWRIYAERLNAACDHLATQANKNARWQPHRAAVAQLVSALKEDVAGPILRADETTKPSLERLVQYSSGRGNVPPAERSLYTDDPSVTLSPRQGG